MGNGFTDCINRYNNPLKKFLYSIGDSTLIQMNQFDKKSIVLDKSGILKSYLYASDYKRWYFYRNMIEGILRDSKVYPTEGLNEITLELLNNCISDYKYIHYMSYVNKVGLLRAEDYCEIIAYDEENKVWKMLEKFDINWETNIGKYGELMPEILRKLKII